MPELSKIVQESVESTSNKLANLIISGIKGENVDSRLSVRWNGETKKDVDKILFSSQISLLQAELERKKEQQSDLEHDFDSDRPIMETSGMLKIIEADITYLQEQIAEIRKLTN